MQKNLRKLAALVLIASASLTACKKETNNNPGVEVNETELKAHTQDQANVSNEIDALTNDINLALEADPGFAGRYMNVANLCNATAVADTSSDPRTITITYTGANCANNRTRTGEVVLSMPANTRWKNAGAVITVTINNLKITRTSDNKSITINGTKTFTNVSGGKLIQLPNLTSIIHDVASTGLSIRFDDSTSRNWQLARRRTYTLENNQLVISTTGRHAAGNLTTIAEWGTDRFGRVFATAITQPLVIRQDCGFRLTSGQVQHERALATAVVTFGLDAAGVATTCPSGNYYYKIMWTGPGGNTHTLIQPY